MDKDAKNQLEEKMTAFVFRALEGEKASDKELEILPEVLKIFIGFTSQL